MISYKIGIRVPAGKVFDKIQDFDDSINKSMKSFGFLSDQEVMTTILLPWQLNVPDGITEEDLEKCKQIVLDGMKEHFGFAEIESFVRG